MCQAQNNSKGNHFSSTHYVSAACWVLCLSGFTMMGTQWWCIVGFCSVITSKSQQLMTRKILSFSLMGLWITWNKCISGLPLGSLPRTGSLQSTHFLGRFWKKWKKTSQITQTHTSSHCIHGPSLKDNPASVEWGNKLHLADSRVWTNNWESNLPLAAYTKMSEQLLVIC